jgi:PBP1b-binding outer membrane lipoprotein LpoB
MSLEARAAAHRSSLTLPFAPMRTLSNSFFALLFASLLMVGCGGSAETEEMAADSTAVMTETVEAAPDTTVAPIDSTVAQPE